MALLRAHKTWGYVSPTPSKGSSCVPCKPLKGLELCCPLKCHLPHVAIEYLKSGSSKLRHAVKYAASCKDLWGKKKNVKYLVNFYIDCMLKWSYFRYAGWNSSISFQALFKLISLVSSPFLNVATRTFKIASVARIMFLFYRDALG